MKNNHLDEKDLHEKMKEFAQYLLLMRKMQDRSDAAFIATLGNLNVQQLAVINTIGDHQTLTMSEIAKQVLLSLSSVTLIVNKLVKMGLVKRQRDKKDRRVVYGVLSEKGQQIYLIQVKHLQDIIKKMFDALNEDEQTNLIKIFRKLSQAWLSNLQG